VTVENQGSFIESFFDVYVFANSTLIGSQNVPSLAPGANTTIAFVWNTTGYAYGSYNITGVVIPVPSETDTADNTLTDDETLKVVTIGDIDGTGKVELMDFYYASNAYLSTPGKPNWCPNADIYSWPNGDGKIEMMDFYVLSQHYLHTAP
jgi:hypothetical protein